MPINIKIKNIPSGYQSIITNGRNSIVGDEPVKSKGTDLGLSPEELLLASIGMCKVTTVRFIARRNNWEIRDVDADLTMATKKNENGKLLTNVQVSIKIEGTLTPDQKKELLKQADACYVHRILDGDFIIHDAIENVEVSMGE